MSNPCSNCGSDIRACVDCDFYKGKYIEIPDKATNGDVIKAVFPDAKISELKSKYERTKIAVEWKFESIPAYYNLFYEDWWNAPYKAGDTDENN